MEATYIDRDEIVLGDGARFTRTPNGTYAGEPTPGHVGEIQGQLSDHTRIAFVRPNNNGESAGFEIDYFLRET